VEAARRPRLPALTAREERVRRLLMRELDGLNRKLQVPTKSWAEKKEREGLARLDVAYIDREIAKMRRDLDHPWGLRVLLLVPMVILGVVLGASTADPDFTSPWGHVLNAGIFAFNAAITGWAYWQKTEALRRKLYIYEALRALSDADELDVVLSRATEQADRLIEAITARELETSRRLRLSLDPLPSSDDSTPARTRVR
jgi:hypothetical protein